MLARNILLNTFVPGFTACIAPSSPASAVQAEPVVGNISASTDPLVAHEDITLNFRKQKDIKGPDGKIAFKEWKRQPFKLGVPMPTLAGIMAAMQDPKQGTLILDSVKDTILNVLKGIVNNLIPEEAYAGTQFQLEIGSVDLNKLTLEAIANMPKSERGSGIGKDMLESFGADYKAAMLSPEGIAASGKARTADLLDQHVAILVGRFNTIRARSDLLEQMDGLLDVWVTTSPNADEHATVFEYLKGRLESFRNVAEITEL